MTTQPEIDIYAVGWISAHVQKHPNEIALAAERLHLTPQVRINGVDHYCSVAVNVIFKYFEQRRSTCAHN